MSWLLSLQPAAKADLETAVGDIALRLTMIMIAVAGLALAIGKAL